MSHGVVPDRVAEGARAGIGPLARALAGMGISANAVTILGGGITVVGAGLLAAGMPLPALLVLLIGTIADRRRAAGRASGRSSTPRSTESPTGRSS
jgi:hypothetical protein